MKLRAAVQQHVDKHGYKAAGKQAAKDIKDLPKEKQPKKKAGK